MTHQTIVTVTYTNGVTSLHAFPFWTAGEAFCQRHVSYTSGTISRISLRSGDDARVFWDSSWDEASKIAGLGVFR